MKNIYTISGHSEPEKLSTINFCKVNDIFIRDIRNDRTANDYFEVVVEATDEQKKMLVEFCQE